MTKEEVEKLIAFALKKKSSLDPLPIKYLKKESGDVACLPAHIFNRHLRMDMYQAKNAFKNVVVTPLLKNAGLDVDDPSNFRPISNASLTTKNPSKPVDKNCAHQNIIRHHHGRRQR